MKRVFAVWAAMMAQLGLAAGQDAPQSASWILETSRTPGGICVLIGDQGGRMACAMANAERRLVVQALCDSAESLTDARAALRQAGLYGRASADLHAPGMLPYMDNLLNLLVVDGMGVSSGNVPPAAEIARALAPLGMVFLGDSRAAAGSGKPAWAAAMEAALADSGFADIAFDSRQGAWLFARKPWPPDIDEWTHYLHGADGNPVARDTVVGPPQRYQWISDPLWLRSHEYDSSIRGLVTAQGRLIYIEDQAPISAEGPHDLPDKWVLRARDAFNGMPLWQIPIPDWGWRVWKADWFSPRPGDIPFNILKRVVADGDMVYATLGYRAPISQIDARNGTILKTYPGSEQTAEILLHRGTLISSLMEAGGTRVAAFDSASGRTLWISPNLYSGVSADYVKFETAYGKVRQPKLDPTLNTATDGAIVALLDRRDIVALDFATGEEKWRSTFPSTEEDAKAGGINAQTLWVGTLIAIDGVVLHSSPTVLAAFSASNGELLWSQPKRYLQHLWFEWKDVFVIDGLVWTWSAETKSAKLAGNLEGGKANSSWPVYANAYDLKTGALAKQVDLGNIFVTHHHHRCYRNKATTNYILASRRGSEFIDLVNGRHSVNNWVRGTCHLGMMPANGLQYAPPHPCQCYIDEKLNGMNALAPEPRPGAPVQPERIGVRETGPAFGMAAGQAAGAEDWAVFRADSMRTASIATALPAQPELLWRKEIGSGIAAPISVGDRVFAPVADRHSVVALNAADGGELWEFHAGARVDSPPAFHNGTLIFGSADGWVYCLRAEDGALVWRFRAAPAERRIGAFDQIESAWPVHGSVLVMDGVVYCAAGRSSHLDGGLRLYAIDASTGKMLRQATLEGPDYDVETMGDQNYGLPMGSIPDILLGDGSRIFMREQIFDAQLKEQPKAAGKAANVLQAKGGLLDDSYFKRAPWTLGSTIPYANLIALDSAAAYAVQMFDTLQGLDPSVYFVPGGKGYLLYSKDIASGRKEWEWRVPVRVTAMAAAGDRLFAAGVPDMIAADDPLGAFEGRLGAFLFAVDKKSGEKTWETRLQAAPAFDGLIAANRRLFIATQDGALSCYGDRTGRQK